MPIDQAMKEATEVCMSLGLLIIASAVFLKLENKAVLLDVGGLPACVGYLLASYIIFNVPYPEKLLFCFFEKIMGLGTGSRMIKQDAKIVIDYVSKIKKAVSAAVDTAAAAVDLNKIDSVKTNLFTCSYFKH